MIILFIGQLRESAAKDKDSDLKVPIGQNIVFFLVSFVLLVVFYLQNITYIKIYKTQRYLIARNHINH